MAPTGWRAPQTQGDPPQNTARLAGGDEWDAFVAETGLLFLLANDEAVSDNSPAVFIRNCAIEMGWQTTAIPSQGSGVSMSMGWAAGQGLGVTHGMMGSNTLWAATALMDRKAGLTAMVVGNDGRTKVLTGSAQLAAQLLKMHRP